VTTTTDYERPRYMISGAAELVGMHPQTLRIYESKGLVRPGRTPGGTRLYSEHDLDRLRLVQHGAGVVHRARERVEPLGFKHAAAADQVEKLVAAHG